MIEVAAVDHQAALGANGPEPAAEPARVDPIAGELVTETFEYDGGRQVTVYVPPDPPKAVVFAGDGQLISQWGGYVEAADVPPTMIVGAYRTDDADELCASMSTHRRSTGNGSLRTSGSSSRMSADG
jgi:hypothetical protein